MYGSIPMSTSRVTAFGRVVGVQRGEHQVAGERRLQRDLRRLLVADLADQHDVGVLPEDRPQRRGEGEPRLLVHLHLHDVLAQPVLHRVFHRHDVDALALDQPDRRVERGRLARAGRPGDEDDPFLVAEQPLDRLLLVLGACPSASRLEHRGALAQDPDHDLLAERGRQGRDPEVHRLAVHRDARAAVLRPEPVGDVEPGHDLDPGDERAARRCAGSS